MHTNDIDSGTLKGRVREVLDSISALGTRDTASNDGDIVLAETKRVFEVSGDFTEPSLSCNNGPNARPRFILEIYALLEVR